MGKCTTNLFANQLVKSVGELFNGDTVREIRLLEHVPQDVVRIARAPTCRKAERAPNSVGEGDGDLERAGSSILIIGIFQIPSVSSSHPVEAGQTGLHVRTSGLFVLVGSPAVLSRDGLTDELNQQPPPKSLRKILNGWIYFVSLGVRHDYSSCVF